MPDFATLTFVGMVQKSIDADGAYTTTIGPSTVVFTFDPVGRDTTYQIDGATATQWQVIALIKQYPS